MAGLHLGLSFLVVPPNEGPFTTSDSDSQRLSFSTSQSKKELRSWQIMVHERAHVMDLFSSPLGFLLFTMEQVRLFSAGRLVAMASPFLHKNEHLKLPIDSYLIENPMTPPTLLLAARDHAKLKSCMFMIRHGLYGSHEFDGLVRVKTSALQLALATIPIVNRSVNYPLGSDLSPSHRTLDLVEVLGMLSEFNFLAFGHAKTEASLNSAKLDGMLNSFSRDNHVVDLYSKLTSLDVSKAHPFLPRYLVWKSLSPPVMVPYLFDTAAATEAWKLHPVERLERIVSAAGQMAKEIPAYIPHHDPFESLLAVDSAVSAAAGLETLMDVRELVLSRHPQFPISLNSIEKECIKVSENAYASAAEGLREFWANLSISLPHLVYGIELQPDNGKRLDPHLPLPDFELVGSHFRRMQRKSSDADELRHYEDFLLRCVVFELDADRSTGVLSSLIGSNFFDQLEGLQRSCGKVSSENEPGPLEMTMLRFGIDFRRFLDARRPIESFMQRYSHYSDLFGRVMESYERECGR